MTAAFAVLIFRLLVPALIMFRPFDDVTVPFYRSPG